MPRIISVMKLTPQTAVLFCSLLLFMPGCRKQEPAKKDSAALEVSTPNATPSAPGKKIKDLTLDEAHNAYAYYKSMGKDNQVANVIERIVLLSTDQDEIEKLLREVGEIKIKQELYEEAEVFFSNYLTLFPGSKIADSIEAQLILAIHKQSHGATRDLSKVKATISRAKAFITRFGEQNANTPLVNSLLEQSYLTLLEHEASQIAFYLNRYQHAPSPEKALVAAQGRAQHAQTKELIPLKPNAEEQEQLNQAYQPINESNFTKRPLEEEYAALQAYQSALIAFIQKRETLVHPTEKTTSTWWRFF